ncbi:hypothetical protein SXIM_43440 [Streptomyces xiamenensis]|uniref:Uncharacterized protein n=1 Tax=Streptomyces xiamenensis TaxID=408015 RepID=A0A0F7FZP6_9ACTN|nr:hypothetical protein SXIM_43440 [Streptomyces xiamenensis]
MRLWSAPLPCSRPAVVGPENEKTPRGCERSARGSRHGGRVTRGGVGRRSLRTGALVTHNHGDREHVPSVAQDVRTNGCVSRFGR